MPSSSLSSSSSDDDFPSKNGHFRMTSSICQLTDLPETLFLEVLEYLSPREVILCQQISRDSHKSLTRADLSRTLLLYFFPRSIEGRLLKALVLENNHDTIGSKDWPAIFAQVARRYHHLSIAQPRSLEKVSPLKDLERLRGVTPWNRFLKLDDKTAPFHYWDPVWTCGVEEGLLVYPAPEHEYRALDLGTRKEYTVPFEMEGKLVRRIRLNDGILVFEWCGLDAFPELDDRAVRYRHYATAYDVTRHGSPYSMLPSYAGLEEDEASWAISFRSEWKIDYPGLPLGQHDRLFSVHNKSHYAVYIWQPIDHQFNDVQPTERLRVWDMSQFPSHRPLPSANKMPNPQHCTRPPEILHLSNNDLTHWHVRQRHIPSLRTLALDPCTQDAHGNLTGHVFLTEEEHRWAGGPHASPVPPRLHLVRSTGIPLSGHGPRWVDECGADGDGAMSFCSRGRDEEPRWPGRAPCWRHEEFPYLTVAEMVDASAGVRVCARNCFMLEVVSVHVRPKLRIGGVSVGDRWDVTREGGDPEAGSGSGDGSLSDGGGGRGRGKEVQFADDMWGELLGKGVIAGDERWLIGEDGKGAITIVRF